MRIGGITDYSTIDWHGCVSIVVFFAGCNFRCPYCQNASLIPLDSGFEVSIEDIGGRIEGMSIFVDSVVISGGEPLIQPEALREVCMVAKKYGLKTMIETNGSKPDVIEELIKDKLLDYIALDFKTSPCKYHLVGGEPPFEALAVLLRYDVGFEIRTTIGSVATEADLKVIASIIPKDCKWVHQTERFI